MASREGAWWKPLSVGGSMAVAEVVEGRCQGRIAVIEVVRDVPVSSLDELLLLLLFFLRCFHHCRTLSIAVTDDKKPSLEA